MFLEFKTINYIISNIEDFIRVLEDFGKNNEYELYLSKGSLASLSGLLDQSIKSIEISSLRFEYSANSLIFSSDIVIGNIPFLKQLL